MNIDAIKALAIPVLTALGVSGGVSGGSVYLSSDQWVTVAQLQRETARQYQDRIDELQLELDLGNPDEKRAQFIRALINQLSSKRDAAED